MITANWFLFERQLATRVRGDLQPGKGSRVPRKKINSNKQQLELARANFYMPRIVAGTLLLEKNNSGVTITAASKTTSPY